LATSFGVTMTVILYYYCGNLAPVSKRGAKILCG